MKLAPLHCTNCGATLPLSVPAPAVPCPYCHTVCQLPPAYVQASEQRRRESDARRRAEPLWRALSTGAPAWTRWAGYTATALVPPLATLAAWLSSGHDLGTERVTALVSLPALLPGAALSVWSSAVSGTTMRFTAALAAHVEGEAPLCRECGAPLAPEPGALAATCGYCGVDSLLEKIEVRSFTQSARDAVSTLDEAVRRLRARRAMLGLGALALALLIGGSSALLWVVTRQSG